MVVGTYAVSPVSPHDLSLYIFSLYIFSLYIYDFRICSYTRIGAEIWNVSAPWGSAKLIRNPLD